MTEIPHKPKITKIHPSNQENDQNIVQTLEIDQNTHKHKNLPKYYRNLKIEQNTFES